MVQEYIIIVEPLTLVMMMVGSNKMMCSSSTWRMAECSFLYIGIRFLGSATPAWTYTTRAT